MDYENFERFLERFGFPLVVLFVICVALWRAAKWIAPRADRLVNRHEQLLDKLEIELVAHTGILSHIEESLTAHSGILERMEENQREGMARLARIDERRASG